MGITFFDVIACSGGFSIIAWIAIFTMWPVAFVLGLISLVASSSREKNITPLPFKILIIFTVIYLFIGALGAINESLASIESIGYVGSDKARLLALSISNSLYILAFTLLGMIPFLFFISVSVIVLHFRQLQLTVDELMALEEDK